MKKITFRTANSSGHIEVPDNMSNEDVIAMLNNQQPEEPLPPSGIEFVKPAGKEADEELPIEQKILERNYSDDVTEPPLPPAGITFDK